MKILCESGFTDISAHEINGSDLSGYRANMPHMFIRTRTTGRFHRTEFDAATLLDVVEHNLDPSYLIEECSRILRKNGIIYFHTPVVTLTDRMMHFIQQTPGLRKVGILWQGGRTSIFHLQNYTSQAIEYLLNNAGFGEIEIAIKMNIMARQEIGTYLLDRLKLPSSLAPLLAPLAYPFLSTTLFNSNKAIVRARKL